MKSNESRQPTSELAVTGIAQYEGWFAKTIPVTEELRPGLWSIPIPIPIPSLGYVNCYVFETSAGLVVIDPGWNCDESWQALCSGLAVIGTSPEHILLILATHFHPDHLGLAARVRSVSDAPIGLHRLDAERLAANRASAGEQATSLLLEMIERIGIPAGDAAEFLEVVKDERYFGLKKPDMYLEDGDVIRVSSWRLRTVFTPGHSPGHVCFFEEQANLLLSGDHVLPKISPNISLRLVGAEPDENPLEAYLASLRRISTYRPVEVLPAHRWRFTPLSLRIEELLLHHQRRLEEAHAVVAAGAETAWQIAQALSWSRPWVTFATRAKRAAIGETLAHLVALESRGALHRRRGLPERWSVS